MTVLSADAYLTHLDADLDAFRQCLADLTAPVAACPGWQVGDLVAHVGETYQWVAAALESQTAPDDPESGPRDPAILPSWFDVQAAMICARLRRANPDDPCWTMGAPHTNYFWIRRMAHETAIHRWDAQDAHGDAVPIAADLALDGIQEVAEMFLPRQIRLGRQRPLAQTISLTPSGSVPIVLATGTDAAPSADIAGPAEALLLLLWKRIVLDDARLAVTGDADAVTTVLSAALTP